MSILDFMKSNIEDKDSIHKALLKKVREDFIDQGGMDGRFKEKVIPSKKKYKRSKLKEEVINWNFLYWD